VRTYRFVVRLLRPPADAQLRRLFATTHDCCVEVGAWRAWAAVTVDRAAPSLADALGSAIEDLASAGLSPVESGPGEDTSVPGDDAVYAAANLVLQLRAVAPQVERFAVLASLVPGSVEAATPGRTRRPWRPGRTPPTRPG
jgi:hypothetical protein